MRLAVKGNSRILKWRYISTILFAIFWGYIPLHRFYIGLIDGRYLQFRFLKCFRMILYMDISLTTLENNGKPTKTTSIPLLPWFHIHVLYNRLSMFFCFMVQNHVLLSKKKKNAEQNVIIMVHVY